LHGGDEEDEMARSVRLSSEWVKQHVRAGGSKLYIVARLSVVG
jgi:hypothetical protein